MVIGYHIILTGYGHWLPNDPRGSMSRNIFIPDIQPLGESHYGRKAVQPSRKELQSFHRKAEEKLLHPVLWWDTAERKALIGAFGDIVRENRLTCYACAVLLNHIHFLFRKHKLKAGEMIGMLKTSGREILQNRNLVPKEHPVFSTDICNVYKDNVTAMRNCIRYIENNYEKHRIPIIECDFVTPYNDWPFHNKR